MKKILTFALLFCLSSTFLAQEILMNRYAMRFMETDTGYVLINKHRYIAANVDLAAIPDLFVPYVRGPRQLISSATYRHIQTKEFVFRHCENYELTLAVDFAESDEPTPFMIYIHGGGWQRGSKNAHRLLSQYTAATGGITGVRITYTLSGRENSNAKHSIQDVLYALEWVQNNAEKLNINPNVFGFYGSSAGAHLAAMAAVKTPGTAVLVGQAGIYDLQTARITTQATDPERIRYFAYLDMDFLYAISPINHIVSGRVPRAVFLYHGSADIIVELEQSTRLAEKLSAAGSNVRLDILPNYDHNLSSSDLRETLILNNVQFIIENLN